MDRRRWGWVWCVWLAGALACAQTPAPKPLLPSAVVSNAVGDLFITDRARNQVLESTAAGALVVVAGNGEQGFAGDGGLATAAELNSPQGLALGSDGTLYIADTGNGRVRAVSAAGVISTVAGAGRTGFGGDGAAATAALLSGPAGLAIDTGGALLIADSGNHRVRRVSHGVISTVAGTGKEGFSGDGGPATAALLDSPAALAVWSDGRLAIADTRNQRVRVVAADGTISTVAGTGAAGSSGDGGPATAARLARPSGLAVLPDGTLLIADAENHRVRAVGVDGIIRTVAGTGVQGSAADATAGLAADLDRPRSVAASAFSQPVFAERGNRLVRALLGDGAVYTAAGLTGGRVSGVSLAAPATAVYDVTRVQVSVSGSAATPQGKIELLEGGAVLATAKLSGGSATFSGVPLAAGQHVLTAKYEGDGFNPAGTAAGTTVIVSPAAVVADANDVSAVFGAAVPVLSGTLTGVLPGDAVAPVFTSAAQAGSPVGTYPIAASLSGAASGNYTVSLAPGSGAVHVTQASTATAVSPIGASYSGLPLTIAATVSPQVAGLPTGTVQFFDGGVPVGSAVLAGGRASTVLVSATAGPHSFTASYAGDANFRASTSAAVAASVAAMPDFTLATNGSAQQTVSVGTLASFGVMVTASPGPFSGAVQMSASGLPPGVAVTFSPAALVPGTAGVATTMSVPTATLLSSRQEERWLWLALVVPFIAIGRKRRGMTAGLLLLGLAGCGARTVSEGSANSRSYTITVTGTGTNLAGAVVAHSMQVNLTVE